MGTEFWERGGRSGQKGREESGSDLGKSSSRFASRSAVQGPAKAEPQLYSLRSVLGDAAALAGVAGTDLAGSTRALRLWDTVHTTTGVYNPGVCTRPWTPSPSLAMHLYLALQQGHLRSSSPPRVLGP